MAVTTEIFETWRRPVQVIQRKLAAASEASLLAVLLGACGLIFVAQWPRLSREAYTTLEAAKAAGQPLSEVPSMQALLGINLFALMFIAPLLIYTVAMIAHLISRAFGLKITPMASRLALFWALLVTTPLMLFQGMVSGFIGAGPALTSVGILTAFAFLYIWLRLIRGVAQ